MLEETALAIPSARAVSGMVENELSVRCSRETWLGRAALTFLCLYSDVSIRFSLEVWPCIYWISLSSC